MTKNDIAKQLPFSMEKNKELVDLVFEEMKLALESGENVKIHGFGNFVVRDKSERETTWGTVPAKRVVTFKTGRVLKNKLNE